MGDPKKHRKKFQGPSHPWQKQRIDDEKVFTREYGFKNKKEIWKLNSLLRNFQKQAKKYVKLQTQQAAKEKEQFLVRLQRLGLIDKEATLDSVLQLTPKNLYERRLQTMVVRKNLARKMRQARQFIVHHHIMVDNKKISSPNYLVKVEEEATIKFVPKSPFADEEHPEINLEAQSQKLAAIEELKNKSENKKSESQESKTEKNE